METNSGIDGDLGPARCTSSEEILPLHEEGLSKPFRNIQAGISRIFSPIPALHRSFSSPRDSTGHSWPTWLSNPFGVATSLRASPMERSELQWGTVTLESPQTLCCTKASNSGLWQQDGSFHWKRVKTRRRGFSEMATTPNDKNSSHPIGCFPAGLLNSTASCRCVNASTLVDSRPPSSCSPVPGEPCPPQVTPRICPSISEITNKNAVVKNLHFDTTCQPLSSASSPTEVLEQKQSFSLDHNRFGVRIYPVMQNGIKISNTHYWLLDPPRSFNAQFPSALQRHQSERVSPTCLVSGDSSTAYLNIPTTVHLRCTGSGVDWGATDILQHNEMIKLLKKEVPESTYPECQAVLIGCGYKYDNAVKRLKLELLCRRGYVSLSRCKRLLHKCNWDLTMAGDCARLESESGKLRRMKSTHSCSSPSFVKGPSLPSLRAPLFSDSSFTHGSSVHESQRSSTSLCDRECSFQTKDTG